MCEGVRRLLVRFGRAMHVVRAFWSRDACGSHVMHVLRMCFVELTTLLRRRAEVEYKVSMSEQMVYYLYATKCE